MYDEIQKHLETALHKFSTDEFYNLLLEAKNDYFSFTGKVNEDDEDYETRMNLFNDWYLLQFSSRNDEEVVIEKYIKDSGLEENLAMSFRSVNYSIFEFTGKNIRGQYSFKDILHDKKVSLDKEHPKPTLVKGDIFTGRILSIDNKNYLLPGMCLVPSEIKPSLKKESKKVRNMNNKDEEIKFLFKIESLKTKWLRYGHIDVNKIFVF